jgi:hypothetical protein
MVAAGVVGLATLVTLLLTWYLASKGASSVGEKIENLASQGKETLFGKPSPNPFDDLGTPGLFEWTKARVGLGRHEALHKLREALGIESGKAIGPNDINRLDKLVKLDAYSHSPGFWDRLTGSSKHDDAMEKLKSALGLEKDQTIGKETLERIAQYLKESGSPGILDQAKKATKATGKAATQKVKETLGFDTGTDQSSQDMVTKLKESLGLSSDQPISEDMMQKLQETFNLQTHEPGFLEKLKATLHLGSEQNQPGFVQKVKDATGMDQESSNTEGSIIDKVKDTIGLSSKDKTERAIEDAQHRFQESQKALKRALEEKKKAHV